MAAAEDHKNSHNTPSTSQVTTNNPAVGGGHPASVQVPPHGTALRTDTSSNVGWLPEAHR